MSGLHLLSFATRTVADRATFLGRRYVDLEVGLLSGTVNPVLKSLKHLGWLSLHNEACMEKH